jgi:hypothetical protein
VATTVCGRRASVACFVDSSPPLATHTTPYGGRIGTRSPEPLFSFTTVSVVSIFLNALPARITTLAPTLLPFSSTVSEASKHRPCYCTHTSKAACGRCQARRFCCAAAAAAAGGGGRCLWGACVVERMLLALKIRGLCCGTHALLTANYARLRSVQPSAARYARRRARDEGRRR